MALDPCALSTLESFQAYASLQGCNITSQAQMEALINASSALIERMANRRFKARDYVEWYSGDWQEQLVLKTRPVLYVSRIAYGNQVALTVYYSGNAPRAEVVTTEFGIRLFQVSANGVSTLNEILSADYPTLSLMVAAINALPNFAAQLGGSDGPSDELQPTIFGSFATNGNNIALYVPTFDTPNRNVNRQSGIVGFPGSGWTPWGYWGLWYGGYNGTGVSGGVNAYSNNWGAYMPPGFQGIMVKYRAGHETVPADIEQLCNEVALYMLYQSKTNPLMQSEDIGDYSYSKMQPSALMDMFGARIKSFADVAIGVGSW